MSGKECKHHEGKSSRLLRLIFAVTLVLLFILLVVFLITWAVLQPKKPQFVLLDATLYALAVAAPNSVSSNISLTISFHNPNDHIGIYYDKLDVYATYQNQQLTYFTPIPPTYQGPHDVIVWSPYIVGIDVLVAPYNGHTLEQDCIDGSLPLSINIDAHMRWKVGTLTTGDYRLNITCPLLITFGKPIYKYQLVQSCSIRRDAVAITQVNPPPHSAAFHMELQ